MRAAWYEQRGPAGDVLVVGEMPREPINPLTGGVIGRSDRRSPPWP